MCLKAVIDAIGRPVASSFITVRPSSTSLRVLWALLNSPIANAYAYAHLGKRHNIISDIRRIPIPQTTSFEAVEQAAATYWERAQGDAQPEELQHLLLRVDAKVLQLYALPPTLERAVLDLFAGWPRPGVPFVQEHYFPKELEHPLSLADYLEFSASWERTNRRRHRLIDKRLDGTINQAEQVRLDALQAYADYHLDKLAPRPAHVLDHLEDRLLAARTCSSGER
jgi:hypothetical protein